jgi:hypothetical protein
LIMASARRRATYWRSPGRIIIFMRSWMA